MILWFWNFSRVQNFAKNGQKSTKSRNLIPSKFNTFKVPFFLTLSKQIRREMVLVTDLMTLNIFQAAALLCYLAHTYPEGSVKSIISSSLLYWISPKLTRFFIRETLALLLDASLDIPFAAIRLLDIVENEGRFLLLWKFNHNEKIRPLPTTKKLLNFCVNIKE